MSLLNNSNKSKGKKKGKQPAAKSGSTVAPKGNTNSKAAAKNTRIANRAQRGS